MPLGQYDSTSVCFLRRVKFNLCHISYLVSNQLKTLSEKFAHPIQGEECNIPSQKMSATLSIILLYAVIPSSYAVVENKLIRFVLL